MMLSQKNRRGWISILILLFLYPILGCSQAWFSTTEKMQRALKDLGGQGVGASSSRLVLHIGDSHVARGFTSGPVQVALQHRYGSSVEVRHKGINGATFATWLHHKDLQALSHLTPRLIILSLGTNDSYTRQFSSEVMRRDIDALVRYLEELYPSVPIVFTTPPANYLRSSRKSGRRRGRWVYSTSYLFNSNTAKASALLRSYAQEQKMAYIDLNAYIGSEAQAKKWLSQGWMHSDHVHYTVAGYTKHGEMIGQALVHAIEEACKPGLSNK